MMGLESVVEWMQSKLFQFTGVTGGDVPITSASSCDALTSGRRVAVPSLDLFENQREFRLVVDVPGATPTNTHLAWDDVDTLSVHVQRAASVANVANAQRSEYEELDWYREVSFPPDADGTKAHSTLRDGVLTVRVPKCRTISSKLIPVYAA